MTFLKNIVSLTFHIVPLCGLTAAAQSPVTSPAMQNSNTRWVTALYQTSPGVGWLVMGGRLFRTKDNGTVWTDVTLPETANESMYTLFCLDAEHAWAVFLGGEEFGPSLRVRMVRTKDSGRTWSPLRFDISSYPGVKDGYAWPKRLLFLDAQHGWLQWRTQSGPAFDSGYLFSTSDGGVTWKELTDPPSSGNFRFFTQQDGWMEVGTPAGELDVTHDGGNTWQEASVPAPDNCEHCRHAYGFDSPVFQDHQHGRLMVAFFDDTGTNFTYTHRTYDTQDGGDSWQDTGVQAESLKGEKVSLAGGRQILVYANNETKQIQIRSGANTVGTSYPSGVAERGTVSDVSFVDDLNGWLVYSADLTCIKRQDPASGRLAWGCLELFQKIDLLATTDGGKTFKVITPPPPRSNNHSPKEKGPKNIFGLSPF